MQIASFLAMTKITVLVIGDCSDRGMQIASFLAMTKTGKLQRLWDSSSRWLAGRKPGGGGALKQHPTRHHTRHLMPNPMPSLASSPRLHKSRYWLKRMGFLGFVCPAVGVCLCYKPYMERFCIRFCLKKNSRNEYASQRAASLGDTPERSPGMCS